MIKMQSERPLLVGGEARTEFVTNEQHAKELEKAGLAIRMGEAPDPPTRAQLDDALAALPGEYTDAGYVVGGMRSHFGELFTADDEARVRAAVTGGAGKASDGLTAAQIKEALAAKKIDIPAGVTRKDDLAALLDGAP